VGREAGETDWYRVLQVDPRAHPEIIEAAYRRLVAKCRPEVDPSPGARDRLAQLRAAWNVLGDPQRRAAYDRRRALVGQHTPAPMLAAPRLRALLPLTGRLDFSDGEQRRAPNEIWLGLVNDGTAPLGGEARCSADWLSVRPSRFQLAPGQRLTLAVRLHPGRVRDPMNAAGQVHLVSNGGSVSIPVVAHADPTEGVTFLLVALMAVILLAAVSLHLIVLL